MFVEFMIYDFTTMFKGLYLKSQLCSMSKFVSFGRWTSTVLLQSTIVVLSFVVHTGHLKPIKIMEPSP